MSDHATLLWHRFRRYWSIVLRRWWGKRHPRPSLALRDLARLEAQLRASNPASVGFRAGPGSVVINNRTYGYEAFVAGNLGEISPVRKIRKLTNAQRHCPQCDEGWIKVFSELSYKNWEMHCRTCKYKWTLPVEYRS